jgi:hypothetical protein
MDDALKKSDDYDFSQRNYDAVQVHQRDMCDPVQGISDTCKFDWEKNMILSKEFVPKRKNDRRKNYDFFRIITGREGPYMKNNLPLYTSVL